MTDAPDSETPERDEHELSWLTEADPISVAIGQLIAVIVEATATDGVERKRAIGAVMECHSRVQEALSRRRWH
jgi:aspartokinase-like uncharacterized kinase